MYLSVSDDCSFFVYRYIRVYDAIISQFRASQQAASKKGSENTKDDLMGHMKMTPLLSTPQKRRSKERLENICQKISLSGTVQYTIPFPTLLRLGTIPLFQSIFFTVRPTLSPLFLFLFLFLGWVSNKSAWQGGGITIMSPTKARGGVEGFAART